MLNRLKQIAWGTLFGALIATQATWPVFAQTATLLPNAKQQFFNAQGIPAASGTVDFFIPSTNTRKTTWNTSTESVGNQNPNPVLLDAGGMALIYGDGCYRQVVKDSSGNTIWDQPTCSTGGGSSGGVPSTQGVMVGTIIPWANLTLPNLYLYTAGQAISRSTYSALMTAITFNPTILCQNTISTITVSTDISDKTPIGAPVELSCFAPGTTVVSKLSGQLTLSNPATSTVSISGYIFPWGNGDGSTTFNVPDLRGRVIAGRNNMLSTPGSALTQAYYGVNPNAENAVGGFQNETLSLGMLPTGITSSNATQAITISNGNDYIPMTQNAPATVPVASTGSLYAVYAPSGGGDWVFPRSITSNNSISVTSNNTGSQAAGGALLVPTVQPSMTTDYIIKALPDDSPTGPGVSSIQGMTGAIACGSGLTCNANIISSSAGGLVSGTTTITGGTAGGMLFNNGGLLATTNALNGGVLNDSGGGPAFSATLPSALTIPSPTFSGTVAGSGTIPNSVLQNSSVTVNSVPCTLGSTCSIVASATSVQVGVTGVTSGTPTRILYDNSGTLGEYPITGTGNVVLSASPTLSGTIGGALTWSGAQTYNSAMTYGGVTLSNAVTGTGNMVLGTSPTISGPTVSGPVLSGSVTGTYTLAGTPSIDGSAINSGTVSGSHMAASNLAASGNGGVTGTLPIANGGTGAVTPITARGGANLDIDAATSVGDTNYVIQATDRLIYHTSLTAKRTDTLPAASSVNPGQVLVVADFAGVANATPDAVVFQRAGSDTINGVTSVTAIGSQYGAGIFWSDGTSKWTFFPASTGGGSGSVTDVTITAGTGMSTTGTCNISVSGNCTVGLNKVPYTARATTSFTTDATSSTSTVYSYTLTAGGGGGGGSNSTTGAAGSGGGGGTCRGTFSGVAGGATVTITVGAGGAGGGSTGTNGSDGTGSSIAATGITTIIAGPGSHGNGTTTTLGSGGIGGTCTAGVGVTSIQGGNGIYGTASTSPLPVSGPGGGTMWGPGGLNANPAQVSNGGNGQSCGGGGGGAAYTSSTGGTGANGCAEVTWVSIQ